MAEHGDGGRGLSNGDDNSCLFFTDLAKVDVEAANNAKVWDLEQSLRQC